MAKEYGKLTAEQFKGLIDTLPEIRRQGVELRKAVSEAPKEHMRELLVANYNWGCAYELTFHEHLALMVCGLGMADYLRSLASSPDPQQKMLDDMRGGAIGDESAITLPKQTVIGLVFSLQRTILSIMLFQRSMSSLLQEVREQDSTEALFKAVRVDRAVLAAPSVADRVARAELSKDETFFIHLRSALKGPSKKHWESYQDLRYALFVLRELGFDQLSDAQLERLMVDTLRVYPATPSARALGRRRSLDCLPAAGSWASTTGINMSAVRYQCRQRLPLIVVRRSPRPGTQQLHAAFHRRTSSFLREATRARNRWILDASNIRPPVSRGLPRSKNLILLTNLAPRPGLEPGTYGLTVDRSINP